MSYSPKRTISIVYGSQTGTAEEVAEALSREAHRLHLDYELSSMNDIDINKLISSELALFVCSTTGQGDPPSNMLKFWRFIMRKALPRDLLSQLHFAVVALGDSSYPKYNYVGKKLHNRLKQLSGQPLMPVILGDEQHDLGHDAALDKHLPLLWQAVLRVSPLPAHKSRVSDNVLLPPKYKVVAEGQTISETPSYPTDSQTQSFPSKLISNERVTAPDHFQDVRLVKLDITGCGVKYSPGDVAYVRPHNLKEFVDEFMSLLKLDPDQIVSVQHNYDFSKLPARLQNPMTWRQIATEYLDITAVPRRYLFELMAHFSRDEQEKEKLEEFASAGGQDDRYSYTSRVRRTTLEVLSDFRHTTPYIPMNYIFDLFTPLQPRAFSIASCQAVDQNVVELLVAVVHYRTKLQQPRLGVCSNWLARLHPGDTVDMWLQSGTFKYPHSGEPCILIGPGTGVAPLRSFICQRVAEGHKDNLLIFGCRGQRLDFYFSSQWDQLTSDNKMTLLTAFSRDQDEKYYVWNVMQDNSDLIWQWIDAKNAYVFLAGNAKRMPDDVRATLVKIAKAHLADDGDQAEQYVSTMENSGRFQMECWS